MKVAFAENNVVGSQGLQASKGFSINASAHAFKILSSGLYSDKIRAVLREIGCNAVDAHIVAGCPDRPIRVKLPNQLDDQFYVQDWGPGLSHDEVMSLYTTYFASTKQSSNDLTGAFGLGSKSPFSYTDSFTVTSTQAGAKRTYTLYIGNEGAPIVSLMGEEAAEGDWPSGVRVGFAVRPADYSEFKSKAQLVYRWFRVSPEVRGSEAIKPVEYRYEHADFKRLQAPANDSEMWALMGGVAYPIKPSAVGVTDLDKSQVNLLNFASRMPGLVLCLPIGSVQVAASREELQYDPASVAVLKEKVELAARCVGKDVVDVLEAALRGGWRELCLSKDRVESAIGGYSLKYYFPQFAKLIGVDAKRAAELGKFIGKEYVPVPSKFGCATALRLARRVQGGRNVHSVQVQPISGGKTMFGRAGVVSVLPNTVIAAGVADHASGRAKRAVAEELYDQVLVVTRSPAIKASPADIAAEAAELSAALGNMEIVDLDALPPPDVAPGTGRKRKKKGWVPSLPVGVTYPIVDFQGASGNAELGFISPLFVCTADKHSWGNTSRRVRILSGTLDKDVVVDRGTWDRIWSSYAKVQAAAKIPAAYDSYALLAAQQIRSLGLPQLGWRNAYDYVSDYMKRPEVRDGLRKLVRKKQFEVPEVMGYIQSDAWMQALAFLYRRDKSRSLESLLRKAGLWDSVSAMAAHRPRSGTYSIPEPIQAYQRLAQQFSLEDELAPSIKDAMTVEDLDAAFRARFPLCGPVDAKDFAQFMVDSPANAELLLSHILAKEA